MEFWWWDIRFYRGLRSHAQKVEMKWNEMGHAGHVYKWFFSSMYQL